MDNPDSVVPLKGFCENCGHFAGRHQDLRCHFPDPDNPTCPCPGMVWKDEMYKMDMSNGPTAKVPHHFEHTKGFWYPDKAENAPSGAAK